MDQAAITVDDLLKIGVARSYAYQLVTEGDSSREPSLALAIYIHRKLGAKIGPIADLTDEQIAVLDQITPPPKLGERAA